MIEHFIKACQEMKKKDDGRQQKATDEDFPLLVWVHQAPSSISRKFSAVLKDGRIELGFHVKDSKRLLRFTCGKSSFKENEDNQSCQDIGKVYWTKHQPQISNLRY
jgi:hypothetical protein